MSGSNKLCKTSQPFDTLKPVFTASRASDETMLAGQPPEEVSLCSGCNGAISLGLHHRLAPTSSLKEGYTWRIRCVVLFSSLFRISYNLFFTLFFPWVNVFLWVINATGYSHIDACSLKFKLLLGYMNVCFSFRVLVIVSLHPFLLIT